MELWPPHVYRSDGDKLGIPSSVLTEALRQAHAAQSRGMPAILTLRHLAIRVGVKYELLREYVERKRDPYRTFRIRKRSGGRRLICVPEGPLLRTQRWLARYLLSQSTVHPSSAAYSPGASIVICAARHTGCRWLLKIDIRNFFESISEIQAFRVFAALGYNRLVSFEMARLCTRNYSKSRRLGDPVWSHDPGRYRISGYENHRIGHLPQGAPTSPMLSNLAMVSLDSRIAVIVAEAGFVYTRYADDLIFSASHRSIDRALVTKVLLKVQGELGASGFALNRNKTVIAPPGARKIVLGILVDGPALRLQREYKQRLLQHVYFLRKVGPAHHARERGFFSVWALQRHVDGLVTFAKQVEPQFAAKVRAALAGVEWDPASPL
jgi:RNA-directed DNA polymerase